MSVYYLTGAPAGLDITARLRDGDEILPTVITVAPLLDGVGDPLDAYTATFTPPIALPVLLEWIQDAVVFAAGVPQDGTVVGYELVSSSGTSSTGAVTVADLKTSIRARGFESDTGGQQLVFLNAWQRRIVGGHRWRFMVETASVPAVAGTVTYSLPSSPALQEVVSIRLADNSGQYPELQWVEEEDLLDIANADPARTSGLQPAIYAMTTDATFTVFPAPSVAGTFTIRYLRAAGDLVTDADVASIPQPYTDLLVLGACASLAQRERQLDTMRAFQEEFDGRLREMKAQYGLRQRQSGRRVRESGTWSPGYDGGW